MRFKADRPNCGFDDRAWPRLQILPLGERRTIEFSSTRELVPMMSGMENIQIIPSCPTARSTGGTLVVKGRHVGEDKIVWVRNGGFRNTVVGFRTLRFLVLEPLTLKVSFTFVKDAQAEGEEKRETKRRMGDVGKILQRANEILRPQTGIRLIEQSTRPKTVDQTLGGPVVLLNDDSNGHIRILKAQGDAAAEINVFFLWKFVLKNENQRSDDVGLARTFEPEIFIDDMAESTDEAGAVLAHELLHIFKADHAANDEHLMAETYAGGGTFIPSAVAKDCHKWAGIWQRSRQN